MPAREMRIGKGYVGIIDDSLYNCMLDEQQEVNMALTYEPLNYPSGDKFRDITIPIGTNWQLVVGTYGMHPSIRNKLLGGTLVSSGSETTESKQVESWPANTGTNVFTLTDSVVYNQVVLNYLLPSASDFPLSVFNTTTQYYPTRATALPTASEFSVAVETNPAENSIVTLTMGTITGAYTVGETVNQATSLATGVVVIAEDENDIVTVRTDTSTVFDTSNVVTGASSGATATPSAVSTSYGNGSVIRFLGTVGDTMKFTYAAEDTRAGSGQKIVVDGTTTINSLEGIVASLKTFTEYSADGTNNKEISSEYFHIYAKDVLPSEGGNISLPNGELLNDSITFDVEGDLVISQS